MGKAGVTRTAGVRQNMYSHVGLTRIAAIINIGIYICLSHQLSFVAGLADGSELKSL